MISESACLALASVSSRSPRKAPVAFAWRAIWLRLTPIARSSFTASRVTGGDGRRYRSTAARMSCERVTPAAAAGEREQLDAQAAAARRQSNAKRFRGAVVGLLLRTGHRFLYHKQPYWLPFVRQNFGEMNWVFVPQFAISLLFTKTAAAKAITPPAGPRCRERLRVVVAVGVIAPRAPAHP